jgi:hypothetical protein
MDWEQKIKTCPALWCLTSQVVVFLMQVRVCGVVDFYHLYIRACNAAAKAILFFLLKTANGMSRDLRKASIEAINEANMQEYKSTTILKFLSRISQYEMAYRMQITVPDVMNINDEPLYS